MAESLSGIEAVRRAREEISREHDNDPKKLVEYYMALQKRHQERLIDGTDQGLSLPAPRSAEDRQGLNAR